MIGSVQTAKFGQVERSHKKNENKRNKTSTRPGSEVSPIIRTVSLQKCVAPAPLIPEMNRRKNVLARAKVKNLSEAGLPTWPSLCL